jgi:hypothetical protein
MANIRPPIRNLILGPVASSTAFWVAVLFMFLAVWNMYDVWHLMRKLGTLTASIQQLLLVGAFLLVLATYVFFTELFRMRKQALTEQDEAKIELICSGADIAIKMFAFGVVGLSFGLGLCLVILHQGQSLPSVTR